ncbi:MAG: outer membrane protein OmpA-like peptidoglycan-associated protein [Oceanicoccus sp.]|jgi:outer membrane protein OmpA-like peptidoglycan-associated protein
MNRLITCFVFSISLCLLAVPAYAVKYGASMNQAEWRLELSPFECRMWQPIPYFGDAVFSSRAGEEQMFFLSPVRKAMKAGQASLVSTAPVWDETRGSLDMGMVNVKDSIKPIAVGKRRSFQLLNELYDGMTPVFSRESWYVEGEQVELSLSSINFRRAFSEYRDCLASLLPVNFDQINRSRVQFLTAQHELTTQARTQLDHVVQYVKADPSVVGFYIDGHTDSVGRRLYNLDLSKKRAEKVTSYLVANGVDEAMITTRYHGERYPMSSNGSAKNRAQNRRVTLRLEREGMMVN